MKAPRWMTVRRNPKADTPKTVGFTITADVSAFAAAMKNGSDSIARMGVTMEEAARATRRLADALQVPVRPISGAKRTANPANQVLANALADVRAAQLHQAKALNVQKAGLEMRWYVKGAMHPAYADPAARDAQFQRLLKAGGRAISTANALAFLRGWVEHHPEGAACTCTVTPEHMWTTHYGAVEPGSQMEWDPSCPVHRATAYRGNGSLAGWFSVERELEGWWPGYINARYLNVPQRWIMGMGQEPSDFDWVGLS